MQKRLAKAESLADHDALVPVLNRRAFIESLQRTISYTERYGGEAAVLFLDLDDFKPLNDGFGHAAGDAALRHFGRLLVDNVRDTDTVGRLGGDEFGVILVQVSREEARKKLNSLASAIEKTPCVFEGVSHHLRASIGMHPITCAEGAETVLARADEAMYAAKKRKRAKSIVEDAASTKVSASMALEPELTASEGA
jgi:diguanylate cyclase (GGDEF)-like protein